MCHNRWRLAWLDAAGDIKGYSTRIGIGKDMSGSDWKNIKNASARLDNFAELLETSKWHLWRRRELIRKIKSNPAPSTFIPAKERDGLSSSHREGTEESCQ